MESVPGRNDDGLRGGEAAEGLAPPGWRAVFISWGRLHRADTIARMLGIPSHTIRYFYRGYKGTPLPLTVLKYLLQTLVTLWTCLRERPRVVFVTHPPVFAVLPVFVYAFLFRAKYVIDFHSGCFIQEHWRRWDGLQRFLARRAAVNLAHNAENAKVLESWGAPWEILPSLPPRMPPRGDLPRPSARPRVVYICSFKEDEPVEAVLEAARLVPEADIHVTGKVPATFDARLPPNVHLAGFLSEEAYTALLAAADVILALTLRQGTLLYGAQEAMALHKPLIVSKTSTLEAYFGGGPVFCENEPEALAAALGEALANREALAARMAAFHARYLEEGRARLRALVARLES